MAKFAALGAGLMGGGLLSTLGTIFSLGSSLMGMMGGSSAPSVDTSGQTAALNAQAAATREANDQQKKANEIANRQSEIQAQQSRTQAIRKARIERGNIIAAGSSQGVPDSSSVLGGAGSVISQLSTNIGVSNTLGSLETDRVSALNAGIDFQSQAVGFANQANSIAIQNQAKIQEAQNSGGFSTFLSGIGKGLSSLAGGKSASSIF